MYISKKEVEQILDAIDAIVISWLKGEISFAEFLERYGYPVGEYALDGHESDDAGKAILLSLRDRIEVHETICGSFNPLCSAEDAKETDVH